MSDPMPQNWFGPPWGYQPSAVLYDRKLPPAVHTQNMANLLPKNALRFVMSFSIVM